MNPKDEGFLSDRFGICVICSTPFEQGDRIATAPAAYFKTSRTGSTIRLGHLACALDARKEGPPTDARPAEARPSVARSDTVPCDACGHFVATVDLVLRSSGKVHASVCPQCALAAMQQGDYYHTIEEHASAFGTARQLTKTGQDYDAA
jgi:hypothetical protein